ncbi:MAG: polyprenyl synthetase family protein [Planctomycetes bacterium]|nr:polyprenyl synthetase family protein [Planctomycetota bacterium]
MNMPKNIPGKGLPSFRRIDRPLRQVRRRIYESLEIGGTRAELASFFGPLQAGSGKMLRPGMVLLAGECFGTLTEAHLQVSAMVEMLHHATLLHDDVLDEGCQRRGIPTANCLWGNESAVLLGDFLLSQVFRMAAELDAPVAKVLAQTAARVCEGELRQTVHQRNWQLTEAQYLEIITQKSASFFGGCCRLGAMLSHADEDRTEAVARFGLLAGIAFQITDDLLDMAGDQSHVGKTLHRDLAKDKPTLAVIHLLRTLDAARRVQVHALLEAPDGTGRELAVLLDGAGSLRYARQQAAQYVAQAIQALAEIPASPAKEALIETARFMANRTA